MDLRLKKIADSLNGVIEFTHDPVGNLSGALYNEFHKLLRAPDAVGNLFRTDERGDRKYGPAGQLLESTTPAGKTTYEYDPEGNLIQKNAPGDKIWRYEWNASGHLAKVVRPDGREVTHTYDPMGRRLTKTFGSKRTRWIWDGSLPLHEWTETVESETSDPEVPVSYGIDSELRGILQKLHAQTLSPVVPQGPPEPATLERPITWLFEPDTFEPLARLQGDRRESIVCDHLGTPLAMFDAAGTQTWSLDLDIYGQVRELGGTREACPFRFPGQYEDTETGLYYNRFRYYDPEAGGNPSVIPSSYVAFGK